MKICVLLTGQSLDGEEYDREEDESTYLIIVTDATDAVSVNFSGRCKFLQI